MTLKAVRIIRECPVIAVPGTAKENSTAYQIASGALDLSQKECLAIPMPMTTDRARLEKSHAQGAGMVGRVLSSGRDVAFLTLGDPTVYASYVYIHRRIRAMGYETEIVSGVPSFCAAAARLGISLAEKSGQFHVIPAGCPVDDALSLSGTKVFMKAGSRLGGLVKRLGQSSAGVYIVENCGMDHERILSPEEALDGSAGYYTVVIVKEEKEES